MSYLWSFYSFPESEFGRVFGSGDAAVEKSAIEAATWEEAGFTDPGAAGELAARIVRQGISYDGLTTQEASLLDDLILILFSPEGLWEQLSIEPESPDGLHPEIVEEVAQHVSPEQAQNLLPYLIDGRRFKNGGKPTGEVYCVLSPPEVSSLVGTVMAAVERADQWSEPYVPEVIQECLIDVLDQTAEKKRWCIGFLS